MKTKAGELTLLFFKTHCKVTIIKIVQYISAGKQINKKESRNRLTFMWSTAQRCKSNLVKVFLTNSDETTGYPYQKKMGLILYLIQYTTKNWGLNIDLTIISKAIKLLEENISGDNMGIDGDFMGWQETGKLTTKENRLI